MPRSPYTYCPLCATPLVEKEVSGILRAACPACKFIHFLNPAVVVVVVVQCGETLLLGKRNIEPSKGMWSFCGGYVELGESLEEAARREVKEETNLDIEPQRLIGIYSTDDGALVVVAYHTRVTESQVRSLTAQPEEISELAFFHRDAIPALAFPVHERIVRDWKQSLH